jgi:hypothetical protein
MFLERGQYGAIQLFALAHSALRLLAGQGIREDLGERLQSVHQSGWPGTFAVSRDENQYPDCLSTNRKRSDRKRSRKPPDTVAVHFRFAREFVKP